MEAYEHYLPVISKDALENHFIDGPKFVTQLQKDWLQCAWYWIDNELVHEFRKSNSLQIPMMMKVSKDNRILGSIGIPYLDTAFNHNAAQYIALLSLHQTFI